VDGGAGHDDCDELLEVLRNCSEQLLDIDAALDFAEDGGNYSAGGTDEANTAQQDYDDQVVGSAAEQLESIKDLIRLETSLKTKLEPLSPFSCHSDAGYESVSSPSSSLNCHSPDPASAGPGPVNCISQLDTLDTQMHFATDDHNQMEWRSEPEFSELFPDLI